MPGGLIRSLGNPITLNVDNEEQSFEKPLTAARVVALASAFIAGLNGGPAIDYPIVARQEAAVQPDRKRFTAQKGIAFSRALRVNVQMGARWCCQSCGAARVVEFLRAAASPAVAGDSVEYCEGLAHEPLDAVRRSWRR